MDKHNVRKAVTARDVAEACGVSQATVSYVAYWIPHGIWDTARRKARAPCA